jgi:hypothetical protein
LVETFYKESNLPFSAQSLFDWHFQPACLKRLIPPWEKVKIVDKYEPIVEGRRVRLKVEVFPFIFLPWEAEHYDIIPGRQFKDRSITSPFRSWEHTHEFLEVGEGSILRDSIKFELPFHNLSKNLIGKGISSKLQRNFNYRHEATRYDLESKLFLERYLENVKLKRIVISGSSGLIGKALSIQLTNLGFEVINLSRDFRELSENEEIYGVVHLGGEPVASGVWSKSKKERIYQSRKEGTKVLVEKIRKLKLRPEVFVSASAVGIYGPTRNEPLIEESAPGDGFLADVCKAWEAASNEIAGEIRTVQTRFGLVLSPAGGALKGMIMPFKLGLGGILGDGKHHLSFVILDDAVRAILFALFNRNISGPINVVAPNAVTNETFSRTLGGIFNRPVRFRLPKSLVDLALGEISREALFANQQVVPEKLLKHGFKFGYPELGLGLRYLFGL